MWQVNRSTVEQGSPYEQGTVYKFYHRLKGKKTCEVNATGR